MHSVILRDCRIINPARRLFADIDLKGGKIVCIEPLIMEEFIKRDRVS